MRLIATFENENQTLKKQKEVETFLSEHAIEYDRCDEESEGGFWGITDTAIAYGKRYGHEWKDALRWGDDDQSGFEPIVEKIANSLLLYTYEGHFADLADVLKKSGAVVEEGHDAPTISVELDLKKESDLDLRETFAQMGEVALSDWDFPWKNYEENYGNEACIRFEQAGRKCIFSLPFHPANLALLRKYLKKKSTFFRIDLV